MMGDRGRLVIPADIRARQGLTAGTPIVLVETDRGVVLITRSQAKDLLRDQLRGSSLVDELIADRRAAADVDTRE